MCSSYGFHWKVSVIPLRFIPAFAAEQTKAGMEQSAMTGYCQTVYQEVSEREGNLTGNLADFGRIVHNCGCCLSKLLVHQGNEVSDEQAIGYRFWTGR